MTSGIRRVLVVDDDPNMLRVIQGVLGDEGLHVQTAADGGRAVELLEAEPPPDLMILDVTLPVMDSSSVAARLRELAGAAIPILVITADGRAAQKARHLGAYSYVRKPFDLNTLVNATWRGLGGRPESS